MSDRLQVVKVGGSLLSAPELTHRLSEWLQEQPRETASVLLVGGGVAVDRLRTRHEGGELSEEQAHWAAVEVMDQHARQVASNLEMPVCFALDQRGGGITFFAPSRFLRYAEPTLAGVRLPVGWRVTSDSIAARVAATLGADLVLLKWAPPPFAMATNLQALADNGYVDAFFPQASVELRHFEFQTL